MNGAWCNNCIWSKMTEEEEDNCAEGKKGNAPCYLTSRYYSALALQIELYSAGVFPNFAG